MQSKKTTIFVLLVVVVLIIVIGSAISLSNHPAPATTSIPSYLRLISGFNLVGSSALNSSSAPASLASGLLSGYLNTYSNSTNALLLIRSANYASNTDAQSAYSYIINYTSVSNTTAIGNLTTSERGMITAFNNSLIYSITSINNTNVITATMVLGTGSYNSSEITRTLKIAINETRQQ